MLKYFCDSQNVDFKMDNYLMSNCRFPEFQCFVMKQNFYENFGKLSRDIQVLGFV